jgi:hypothetical protein
MQKLEKNLDRPFTVTSYISDTDIQHFAVLSSSILRTTKNRFAIQSVLNIMSYSNNITNIQ